MMTIGVVAALFLGALGMKQWVMRIHPAIRAFQAHNDGYLAPMKCGALVRLPPNLALYPDGSPIYFDNASGKVVARCDNPLAFPSISPTKRVRCPPAGWTCGP
jgi:hypothetical protein